VSNREVENAARCRCRYTLVRHLGKVNHASSTFSGLFESKVRKFIPLTRVRGKRWIVNKGERNRFHLWNAMLHCTFVSCRCQFTLKPFRTPRSKPFSSRCNASTTKPGQSRKVFKRSSSIMRLANSWLSKACSGPCSEGTGKCRGRCAGCTARRGSARGRDRSRHEGRNRTCERN